MWIIIRFLAKWVIPIGFVEMVCRKKDNLFSKDSIPSANGEMTYWRISEAKNPIKGAGVLIRRS
jgi:hypothetical protein